MIYLVTEYKRDNPLFYSICGGYHTTFAGALSQLYKIFDMIVLSQPIEFDFVLDEPNNVAYIEYGDICYRIMEVNQKENNK